MRLVAGVLFSVLLSTALGQQTTQRGESPQARGLKNHSAWTALGSLVGTWSGEGNGDPGLGTGTFSFAWDLQQRVLIRRSRADYPAANDRAAYSHQDLTIIYQEAQSKRTKAIYFDNEGHTINYEVTVSPDQEIIEFLSEITPSRPRYRLTYAMIGSTGVQMSFDIAPPDKPDSFRTYIQARAKRQ